MPRPSGMTTPPDLWVTIGMQWNYTSARNQQSLLSLLFEFQLITTLPSRVNSSEFILTTGESWHLLILRLVSKTKSVFWVTELRLQSAGTNHSISKRGYTDGQDSCLYSWQTLCRLLIHQNDQCDPRTDVRIHKRTIKIENCDDVTTDPMWAFTHIKLNEDINIGHTFDYINFFKLWPFVKKDLHLNLPNLWHHIYIR